MIWRAYERLVKVPLTPKGVVSLCLLLIKEVGFGAKAKPKIALRQSVM